EALLIFMNEQIGEFLFLIEGVPKKPVPFPVTSDKAMKMDQKREILSLNYNDRCLLLVNVEKLRFKAVVGTSSVFEIDIPVQNIQRQQALVAIRWQ
ncbi:unnamed protein product, partial [Didymodactylos carnosus]